MDFTSTTTVLRPNPLPPSVIMKLLLLATCLAYAKADGHEGMEHGNIVEELIKAGSLVMRKSSQNKDSCKMGIVAE